MTSVKLCETPGRSRDAIRQGILDGIVDSVSLFLKGFKAEPVCCRRDGSIPTVIIPQLTVASWIRGVIHPEVFITM